MEFPRLVYKAKRAGSKDFDHELVADEVEHAAAIKAGWHPTVPDALAAGSKQHTAGAPAAGAPAGSNDGGKGDGGDGNTGTGSSPDTDPPTREELEAKAKELSIPFNARTSNKKLLEAIEAKLANPEGE